MASSASLCIFVNLAVRLKKIITYEVLETAADDKCQNRKQRKKKIHKFTLQEFGFHRSLYFCFLPLQLEKQLKLFKIVYFKML